MSPIHHIEFESNTSRTVDCSFSITFSLDDWSPIDFIRGTPCTDVKVGTWTLHHVPSGLGRMTYVLRWKLEDGSNIRLKASSLTLRNLGSGRVYLVTHKPVANTRVWKWSSEITDYEDSHDSFCLELSLKLEVPPPDGLEREAESPTPVQRRLAWVQDALESAQFFDVTFTFPGGGPRKLHANSRLLAAATPYYSNLFASEFSGTRSSYRSELLVTAAPFNVYRDVLLWIHTGHIDFADSSPPSDLPGRISSAPESVYSLADILGLPELKSLALASIMANVDVANVTEKLMGDLCADYKPVREAMVRFSVGNWSEVKASESWKELKRKVEKGDEDLPASALRVCMRLLQRF